MALKSDPRKAITVGRDQPGAYPLRALPNSLFPHRLSFDEDLVSFLPTDAVKLREASFLDGRSDFATGPARLIALDDLLACDAPAPEPDRFIFHVSFCGSTLLSRLLDHPGKAMILREPQCLSDLAARRAMLEQSGLADDRVEQMLTLLPGLISRRWQDDEPVVIKPSNWINNLVPTMCVGERAILPLFLTMAPRAFLQAVFRGGHERIAFTVRGAIHFSRAGRRTAEHVAAAMHGTDDQTVQLARLAALAWRMQTDLFAAARLAGGWSEERCLSFEELSASPVLAAQRAARLLNLDLEPATVAINAARWLGRDAKQPDATFIARTREAENGAVDDRFGPLIDNALTWLEKIEPF